MFNNCESWNHEFDDYDDGAMGHFGLLQTGKERNMAIRDS